MKKKVITIIGARPQFIKAATVSRVLCKHPGIDEILVHTGQHYDKDMSNIFIDELHMQKPSYSLNIHGGLHGQMTGRMLEALEAVLTEENPAAVLVYGDTNSTLAGALAASKLHIPVIHVEAGLRSNNKLMPEEINRILTDHMSNLLFCPTNAAVLNLKKESITQGVHYTGDIMYDATLYALDIIKNNKKIEERFNGLPDNFILMTIHRAESTESIKNFKRTLEYANEFSEKNNLKIIFPVHPRIKEFTEQCSADFLKNIIFFKPLSYFETQFLLSKASYVLTDSGGLQKEAYFHRVPCITLRTETEWVETIESGWNRLWSVEGYKKRVDIFDYGDGKASQKVVSGIVEYLSSS